MSLKAKKVRLILLVSAAAVAVAALVTLVALGLGRVADGQNASMAGLGDDPLAGAGVLGDKNEQDATDGDEVVVTDSDAAKPADGETNAKPADDKTGEAGSSAQSGGSSGAQSNATSSQPLGGSSAQQGGSTSQAGTKPAGNTSGTASGNAKPAGSNSGTTSGNSGAGATSSSSSSQTKPATSTTTKPASTTTVAQASFYPYYNMLNARERTAYNQLYKNVLNSIATFYPTDGLTTPEAERVVEALYLDRPELFWWVPEFEYGVDAKDENVLIKINFKYDYALIGSYAKSLFDGKVNAIVAQAKTLTTNLERERYVHDAVIKSAVYDRSATNNQSAYSALVSGRTVCAGYARAFQYIMIQLGIPTYYVMGTASGEEHGWNIVFLDGVYYNVDLTLDSKRADYKYFNKSAAEFSRTHTRTGMGRALPK